MSDDEEWAPADMFAEADYENAVFEVTCASSVSLLLAAANVYCSQYGECRLPYITWPAYSSRFESPGVTLTGLPGMHVIESAAAGSVACSKFMATAGAEMMAGQRVLELGAGAVS